MILKSIWFPTNLAQIDWEQIAEKISDVIKEDPNAILLQEMTLSWENQELKRANLRVQSEKSNKSFMISFDHEGSGQTLVHYLGDLETKNKKVKMQEVFKLIQKHKLTAFQDESTEHRYTLILDITYGNQVFSNKDKMEDKLFKVSPSYVKSFENNETLYIPDVVVSFIVNSKIYILENLSKN